MTYPLDNAKQNAAPPNERGSLGISGKIMCILDKHVVISREKDHMLKLLLRAPRARAQLLDANRQLKALSQRRRPVRLATAAGIVLALAFHMWAALPAFSSGPPPLNRTLAGILKKELPRNFAISIQVADLETGRILMEKNPDLPLIPASTMKVVTSAAALSLLKPDFNFVTEVLVAGMRGSSVGNIYLKGRGDPYLVSEQLFALTRAVKEEGLREVRGNIIVDDSYFIPGKPLDEQEDLGTRSYHAPYSALSLNFNTIRVLVHPAEVSGKAARVEAGPVSEYAVVVGDVKTVKGKRRARVSVERGTTEKGAESIRIRGTIGVKAPGRRLYVNVTTPSLYTGSVFKEFLLREGIRVSGKVIRGKTPGTAVPYLEFKSRPLALIVYWLNKFSNNFIAEQVSMAMGAKAHGAPGTREKGISVMRNHLISSGVDEGDFSLTEASGLSRKNRLSASALVRVLQRAAHEFTYSAEFMASMGVAGVDGTLKDRFRGRGVSRRIRAKTGSLRGITALAGYAQSTDGKIIVFAILINSLKKGTGFIDYGDKIIRRIMKIPMKEMSVVGGRR